MTEEALKKGIEEFSSSAEDEEKKSRLRSAAVLYFKAIAELCDLIIYLKLRKTPNNHEERFRILETHFPDVYAHMHRIFPLYRKTYRMNISKEDCERIKNAFKRIKEIENEIEKDI